MALIKLKSKDFVSEVPSFPDFPYAEYKSRISRAKELMSENEIDVLLVWKREDIRYFFGFQTTGWEINYPHSALGIIPLDGEPIIVVSDMYLINAQVFCWARDIRYLPRGYELRQQRVLSKEVANVIKEIGCEKRNIGLEMGATYVGTVWIPRPFDDIQRMMAELPDAKFVDGDKVIWGCRMIKSPLEIDRIRQAGSVIRRCHTAVVDQFRPGMTEMDVAKIMHHIEVDSGDFRGGDSVVCSYISCNNEKEGTCDILALDDVTITKDDFLLLDLQHKHKGYWADMTRAYQVGPITDEVKRAYDLLAEGLHAVEALVKPGVPMSELYKAGYKPLIDAGYQGFELIGHGIGMDVHEPPIITPETDMPLQENMVFALEPWILKKYRRDGGIGMFGLEDQYICTDKGYEKISSLDENIIQVAHPFC